MGDTQGRSYKKIGVGFWGSIDFEHIFLHFRLL